MTIRTRQWLKNNWWGQDPRVRFEDLVDSLDNIVDSGTGAHIWINPQGDDTDGIGSYLNPYATVEQGLSQVSAAKLIVLAMPGTYAENVSWPAVKNARLIGVGKQGAVVIGDGSSGGTSVVKVKPLTSFGGTAFNAYLDNVTIKHAGTGMYIDNSTAAYAFNVRLKDVNFDRTGGTSIITEHGAGTEIGLFVEGPAKSEGLVYVDVTKPLDQAIFRTVNLAGGLATSADTEIGGTATIVFAGCQVKHEGITGGATCQRVSSLFSWSFAGSSTYAALDTADLAGSHTEYIAGIGSASGAS